MSATEKEFNPATLDIASLPSVREIPLTRGKVALVDDEDYERVSQYSWRYIETGKMKKPYVYCPALKQETRFGTLRSMMLHSFIVGPKVGQYIDHKDGNGLNNTRDNLRACTQSQNLANSFKHRVGTSRFKGVRLRKDNNKYSAQIVINSQYIHLGFFTDEIAAAKAYDEAALNHFGEFARLNFPQEARQ